MGRRRVGIIGGETCLLLLVLLPVVTADGFSSTRNQKMGLWAQSFTSFKTDLNQCINRGFAFYRCLNGTFP